MLWRHAAAVGLIVFAGWGETRAKDASPYATPFGASPAELVEAAEQAGARGDSPRRQALLQRAIQIDPDHAPARWASGQVRVDHGWLPAEVAQSVAAADPVVEDYESRRDAVSTADGHAALAKWCGRQGLVAESRFHWLAVLDERPDDRAALNSLGLVRVAGRLVEEDAARAESTNQRLAQRKTRQWSRRVARWEKARTPGFSADDPVLDEVRSIRDEHATPAFESLAERLSDRQDKRFAWRRALTAAYVDALADNRAAEATAGLVRFAVLTPDDALRRDATDALVGRPLLDSVPLLLAGLRAATDSEFSIQVAPTGEVAYSHTVSAETRDADYEVRKSRLARIVPVQGPPRLVGPVGGLFNGTDVDRMARSMWQRRVASAQRRMDYAAQAAEIESRVAALNEGAAEINARITPVLTRVTGQRLGENPRAWWDYWLEFQGYERYDDRPTHVEYDNAEDVSYVLAPGPPPRPSCECFVAGTPVWTKTGRVAIETVQAGDVVLTKDTDTGELGFRAVLATTVRDPSPMLAVSAGDTRLVATVGHPFWVVGKGWRMAKELSTGDLLSTVDGPVEIEAIDSHADAQAYNLIVEGTHDYFVGNRGVLARDNTPRDTSLNVASRR